MAGHLPLLESAIIKCEDVCKRSVGRRWQHLQGGRSSWLSRDDSTMVLFVGRNKAMEQKQFNSIIMINEIKIYDGKRVRTLSIEKGMYALVATNRNGVFHVVPMNKGYGEREAKFLAQGMEIMYNRLRGAQCYVSIIDDDGVVLRTNHQIMIISNKLS